MKTSVSTGSTDFKYFADCGFEALDFQLADYFGENGMFGQGGILGIGSFAEPINRAVDGLTSLRNDD